MERLKKALLLFTRQLESQGGLALLYLKHMEYAQKALQESSNTIDGRITICNLETVSTNPVQTTDQS